MMNKELREAEKQLQLATANLIDAIERKAETEPKYKKVIVKVMQSPAVAGLPNQKMRDASVEEIILNDDRFKPLVEKFTLAEMDVKIGYKTVDMWMEIVKNRRVELNYLLKGGVLE